MKKTDDNEREFETKKKFLVKIVGYDLVNVRKSPSLNAPILFRAKRDDRFLVESLGFAWVRVYDKITKKEIGYVMRELLEEVADGQHS